MNDFIDQLVGSLKQSLDLKLWLYFLLMLILNGLVSFLVFLVFVLAGVVMLVVSLSSVSFANIPLLLSRLSQFLPLVFGLALLFILWILAMLYVSSLFSAAMFALFNGFLEKKKLSLGHAFETAFARAFTLFKVNLLVSIGLAIALLVVFSPLFFALSQSSFVLPNILQVFGALAFVGILVLVLLIAVFLLSPWFSLLTPAVVFGSQGAIDSMKEAFAFVKRDYFGNLVFVIIYMVIVMGVSWVLGMMLSFVQMFTLLPAMVVAESSSAVATGAVLGAFGIYFVVAAVLYVPYIIWSTVFDTSAFRNLYFFNLSRSRKQRK